VSTLERLERIAQSLEEAAELTATSRAVDYLAGAATVRAELRAQIRGEEQILWERLRAVESLAERLADSAPADSEEQRLADRASLTAEYLRGEGL
jgi:hypothetical protein